MSVLNARGQEGLRTFERFLLRQHPNLTDGELTYLLAEAENLIEIRSYAAGDQLCVKSAMDSLARSQIGQLVWSGREEQTSDPKAAHRAKLAEMNPAQRLSYAREHGLA